MTLKTFSSMFFQTRRLREPTSNENRSRLRRSADRKKIRGDEGSAANQPAVNIGLSEQLGRIARLDATAVQQPQRARNCSIGHGQFATNEGVNLLRLRWRCRRGTRELDQLFSGWLDESFARAEPALQLAFGELLEQQDPDLWDWVMGHGQPGRADWQQIIGEIRSRHQL